MKVYNVTATVQVPRVPNYLIMENGQKISIADVMPEALRGLGQLWIEKLVARAEEIRKSRSVTP